MYMASSREEIVRGGCHCGGIQFHFSKPIAQLYICHCTACRKAVGSTGVDFMGVALSKLDFSKDSTLAKYRSSDIGVRLFCKNCGCSIGMQYDEEKHTCWIIRGTLDDDPGEGVSQTYHIWTEEKSRAVWDKLPYDNIPRKLQCEDYLDDPAKDLFSPPV